MGEMTAATGIAHECIKYAGNWDLPITFIVEDNSLYYWHAGDSLA